jgi:DNA repair exonuclease SbcCD nuclease subunit
MPDPKPLRMIHTSDVHLGAYAGNGDVHWAERRELMENTFRRVVDLGIESGAGLFVIAGDFFDNDRVPVETVEFAAEQIRRFPGVCVLLPGNHDPMDDGRIYWRHDLEAMAPNLRIVRAAEGEVIELPGLDAVAWGRGYRDSDWHFRPLDGLPEQRLDNRWHIALAHGHFVPEGGDDHRSLIIHEREIAAAAGTWDYLGFGHWEPHANVSCAGTTAIYSGAPMPLSDANTKAGWAMQVDFDAGGVRWQKHRVDPRPVPTAAK